MNIDQSEIETVLEEVLRLLAENDTIKDYQHAAKRIEDHQGINQLIADIKEQQQAGVAFNHYEKPKAAAKAFRQTDELIEQLNTHPLVVAYQNRLVEANSLLQSLTNQLEDQINQGLQADYHPDSSKMSDQQAKESE